MEKFTIINHVFLMSLLTLNASWSIPLAHAAEQPTKETMRRAPTVDLSTVAANSVHDTLNACLARIPKDATVGQRLLAEQNCQGEERTRRETEVTPRF